MCGVVYADSTQTPVSQSGNDVQEIADVTDDYIDADDIEFDEYFDEESGSDFSDIDYETEYEFELDEYVADGTADYSESEWSDDFLEPDYSSDLTALSATVAPDDEYEYDARDPERESEPCDERCQKVAALYTSFESLNWGMAGPYSQRYYAVNSAEELLDALGQNTDKLRANAAAMREKEQSMANKLLTAAAIGSVGLGTMELMSGLAEQKADEDAERDMRAYLATFTCDYGRGRNIKGGETGIELPAVPELITSKQEYMTLAASLKTMKAELGLKPGIESEIILDSATMGLYDNESLGRRPGAFTSLSRALMDPNGEDAKQWATQKDATAKKVKTGATVAGAGIVGSIAGNLAINSNGPKNKSDELLAERKTIKRKITARQERLILDRGNVEIELKQIIINELQACNDRIIELQEQIKADPSTDEEDKAWEAKVLALPLLDIDGDVLQLKGHLLCSEQ